MESGNYTEDSNYRIAPFSHRMDNFTTIDFAMPSPDFLLTAFPLEYRILATFLHGLIFLLGVPGNILLIFIALTTKTLQSPTYRYLVSLAFADLLVLLSAVPEAIASYHMQRDWIAGQAACSVFIFITFLGINAGSISILAFTFEMYVAICRPLISRKVCTMHRTNQIIFSLWILAILYCSVWLGLTEVKPDPYLGGRQQCDFRLSKDQYIYIFAADLSLYYIIPLIIAGVVYVKIALVLHRSLQHYRNDMAPSKLNSTDPEVDAEPELEPYVNGETNAEPEALSTDAALFSSNILPKQLQQQHSVDRRMKSRSRVLRMLIVIVVLFAIAWLPYRGLLVYNTFLEEPWLNIWYLFFAKTLIYLNSAMNPFLYSYMSRRFRTSVHELMRCHYRACNPETQCRKLSQPSFDKETVHIRGAVSMSVSGALLCTQPNENIETVF